jgi:hypothetical protein
MAMVRVQQSDYWIAKCEEWAKRIAERYGSGDVLHAMPWTRNQMTDDELRQWRDSRKEAGRAIDIETCEIGQWHVNEVDEYGIREQLGELHPELVGISLNRWIFVRSPQSSGWISEGDLPLEKARAMYDRINRESAAKRGAKGGQPGRVK